MLAQVKEPNTGVLQSTIIWFFKILAVIGGLWRAEKSAAEKHIFAFAGYPRHKSFQRKQGGETTLSLDRPMHTPGAEPFLFATRTTKRHPGATDSNHVGLRGTKGSWAVDRVLVHELHTRVEFDTRCLICAGGENGHVNCSNLCVEEDFAARLMLINAIENRELAHPCPQNDITLIPNWRLLLG